MEPEVHIIEKYFQKILNCLTMTNVRLKGGKEIDLLAMNPKTGMKFHVESRVATSRSFALRLEDTHTSAGRPHRRGLDFFAKQKFNHPVVLDKIHELFGDSSYRKVLVVWNVRDENVPKLAKEIFNIEIWRMRGLLHDMMKKRVTVGPRDDILRTMELVASMRKEERTFLKKIDKLT